MNKKSSGTKPIEISDITIIEYTNEQWEILKKKRDKTIEIMDNLQKNGVKTILYGSICRGDVNVESDIDLFIPYQLSSFKIESAIEKEGMNIYAKNIVQATPKHLVKGHIYLDESTCITFPLTSIRKREFDFIRFGGSLELEPLKKNMRVPGVDKRLILIEPIQEGHKEAPVIGYESIVAKIVGVDVELVKERVRILTTRDKRGRTGVYLNYPLAIEENFEEIFKELKDKDPIIRRRSKR